MTVLPTPPTDDTAIMLTRLRELIDDASPLRLANPGSRKAVAWAVEHLAELKAISWEMTRYRNALDSILDRTDSVSPSEMLGAGFLVGSIYRIATDALKPEERKL